MMREAEGERAKAEVLLAQAQQELARQRRAEERERASSVPSEPADAVRDERETEQFAQLLERAEVELGAVRDELRQLSDEMKSHGAEGRATVLVGETVRGDTDEKAGGNHEAALWEPADGGKRDTRIPSNSGEVGAGASGRPVVGSGPAQSRPARPRKPLSPQGRAMAFVTFLAVGLPLPIAGSALHTMYSANPGPAVVWGLAFDLGVVVASVVVAGLIYLGLGLTLDWTGDGMLVGCIVHVIAGSGLFITGIVMDPDTVPLLTQVGRPVVEYLGPL
ncbi:hypothetical protein GCM10011579_042790 [Streptomyces albiflavescens]|uniref:Uncharacterized protein n=2 Tax=Streptomyces albiflavescens TaxID=1623582 RepID=A0A917Y7R9_9ACTN|nr:hypothetical protein GCM10011579_042790 [Streptomyces albiflavescens]